MSVHLPPAPDVSVASCWNSGFAAARERIVSAVPACLVETRPVSLTASPNEISGVESVSETQRAGSTIGVLKAPR